MMEIPENHQAFCKAIAKVYQQDQYSVHNMGQYDS